TQEELRRSRMLNQALVHELQSGKHASPPQLLTDKAATMPVVKTIVIGRQTGGIDDDPTPGDEALQVVVEPRDHAGHAIKAVGSLEVTALEIDPHGAQTPLAT